MAETPKKKTTGKVPGGSKKRSSTAKKAGKKGVEKAKRQGHNKSGKSDDE